VIRIDDRTVELTDRELNATIRFERLLDRGSSIPDAINRVQSIHPNLSREFYAWLSFDLRPRCSP
jgi:hypothetical protein